MAGGNLLDDDAFDRNLRAVRAYEAGAPVRPGLLSADRVVTVRVTGAVDGDGNYPGVVTVKDPDAAGGYADYAVCRACPLNSEALVSGKRYATGWVGYTAAGLELFQVVGPGGDSAGSAPPPTSFVGARLAHTGGTFTVPGTGAPYYQVFDTAVYDTGGLFNLAAPDRLTIAVQGYYAFGASAWVGKPVAGGYVGLQIRPNGTTVDYITVSSPVSPGGAGYMFLSAHTQGYLTVGNYLRVSLEQSATGVDITSLGDYPLSLSAPAFWIALLGT